MKHIFTKLLSIFCTSQACALKQEAYAIMSPDGTTLTFYYDNKKASRKGTAYEINAEDSIPKWVKLDEHSEPKNPNFTIVVFDKSFKDARPLSCAYWFAGFTELTKIEGISNLNTSNVTDMSYMFSDCKNLTTLDMRNFDTSKVTDMHNMFEWCINLSTLDMRNFDTSNVTDMSGMFDGCESLTTLDMSNFDTSNTTNMHRMFNACKNLTTLDVRNFDTSNVTDMSGMFSFCKNLTSINVSSFDTSNVTNMDYMFDYSEKLKTIYAGDGWNTSKIGYSRGMFENCTNLVGGKGTTFNSKVIDITRAKIDGGKANPGYLTAKK